jgi:5-methylcytosine-specific restriction endonuclease McrA
MDFSEQYKHPLWQKKRLEILERDEFMCQSCGDTDSQLHVHHWTYVKNRKIWDYENENFETLCDNCHSYIHELKDKIKDNIDNNFKFHVSLEYLSQIIDYLSELSTGDLIELSDSIKNIKFKR